MRIFSPNRIRRKLAYFLLNFHPEKTYVLIDIIESKEMLFAIGDRN